MTYDIVPSGVRKWRIALCRQFARIGTQRVETKMRWSPCSHIQASFLISWPAWSSSPWMTQGQYSTKPRFRSRDPPWPISLRMVHGGASSTPTLRTLSSVKVIRNLEQLLMGLYSVIMSFDANIRNCNTLHLLRIIIIKCIIHLLLWLFYICDDVGFCK